MNVRNAGASEEASEDEIALCSRSGSFHEWICSGFGFRWPQRRNFAPSLGRVTTSREWRSGRQKDTEPQVHSLLPCAPRVHLEGRPRSEWVCTDSQSSMSSCGPEK